MEVVIQPDANAVANVVADAIERLVTSKPDAVLGLATGSSPLGVYSELVRRYNAGALSFERVTAFLLDEYIGLPPGHPESYRAFIERHFSGLVDIDPANVHVPDGAAADIDAACAEYESMIRAAGGVDLQLLGIGADGHLGFNEPTSSLASRTRVKTLTEQTRRDNNRFFGALDEVPRHVRHPRDRHDPGCTPPGADRHRRRQGRTGRPRGRRTGRVDVPGIGDPAAPTRDRRHRRSRGESADPDRLLPRHLRQQTPWQSI